MRKPRSFTCASARPRHSSTPSARQRARSPLRYIRPPGRSIAIRDKPLRRQPGPAQIAPRKTRTRNVELPHNTNRHRLQPTVQNINPRVPDRPANGSSGWPFRCVAGEIVKGGNVSFCRAVVIVELCKPIATEKGAKILIKRDSLASLYDMLQNCWVVPFFANDLA